MDPSDQHLPDSAQPHVPGAVGQGTGASLIQVRQADPEAYGPAAGGDATIDSGPPRQVDDAWRRWIAENLMLEVPPERLLEAMVADGIGRREAAAEIDLARRSPYVRGAERLRERLKKRDWLLATYRTLRRLDPGSAEIERRSELSRGEFLERYYCANRPVIITGMMEGWPALRNWSLEYFERRFGDREIEVQFGRTSAADYEVERQRFVRRLSFGEFVARVRWAGVTNDFYLTANNSSWNKAALPELWDDVGPLPEYLDGGDRRAGFFWLGPAGTVTPFHHDLTNNLMAQVLGRKRVKIAPSWDLPLMDNHYHVYSTRDGRAMPPAPNPGPAAPQVLECVLHPGEILFLPVGCMHHVEGLDISATVSFTNFVVDNDFFSSYTTYHGV